jgi:hypothetical protein
MGKRAAILKHVSLRFEAVEAYRVVRRLGSNIV